METKDSITNLTSFGALSMAWANIESILTVVVLLTAIALNILRFREIVKKKKEDK